VDPTCGTARRHSTTTASIPGFGCLCQGASCIIRSGSTLEAGNPFDLSAVVINYIYFWKSPTILRSCFLSYLSCISVDTIICHGRDAVCAVRRYSCQSDQIQSYVRSRSQLGGCFDDEDVARRATNTWERRSACKAGARLTCLLKHYEQCHGIRDPDRNTESSVRVNTVTRPSLLT